ncbi:thiol:disulfide interchange protein DsbA/DsbL [Luteimonas sp. MC1750]|uniref:thiol:disulfide interchange protein DsbA/DsbL n=1 Tax=Luteimonas sp. MC1750 TaxID=2799326 RepID=UPI0018F0FF9E|nr:thiol:disulfide interchange protein DsbA/DsbL [Luteimonas sp. MC1750]MBJ6985638.1 thiol:disulfide interchange protein DsbA/DsbL [Luteimonas sp. MC1750]QQO06117.1 thiol:disulfide interchange protein DsbA/DsbL [Luteimonas sp. MC1750]
MPMLQRLSTALLVLALATLAWLPASARADDGLVEGHDFVTIPDGEPLRAEPGKVEVVEVFAYWCHVCNDFQPVLAQWQRRLPADVAFRYLPGAFTQNDAAARAYFAAASLGALDKTHEPTYRALHVEQSLPARGASLDEYATLYAGFGLDRAQVLAAMRSPETDAQMDAARRFIMAAGVQGTPTIIVNGRYRVIGRSFGDLLRITDLLVARERAAGAR